MRACAKTAATTSIRRRTSDQLNSELLEHLQHFALLRAAVGQAEINQHALSANRRTLAQMLNQIFHCIFAALLALNQPG